MAYDPSIFNISPYYDDFKVDSGFLRVLFRPGYSVQARELTQAQSILQNQVSKLGDNLFKDGSRIVGGGMSSRTTSAIRITVLSLSEASVTDYDDLIGQELTQSSGTIKAKIISYVPLLAGESSTHLVVIVDFTSGYAFSPSTVVYKTTTLVVVGSTESCKLITVGDGIFYVDGFFVPVTTQHLTPSRVVGLTLDVSFGGTAGTFNQLSTRIGFNVVRDTVTSEENSSLRDPAIGSSNYNAPGGDRYKIDLVLAQSGITSGIDDFIELLRFEDGSIIRKSERVSYAEIEKTLSRRTFEESGSYVVRPFDLNIKDAGGLTLSFVLGSGKAYVLGQETETQYPKTLSVTKARTTQLADDLSFPFTVGNFVGVCMGASASSGITFATNLVGIGSASSIVKFRNTAGSVMATGYVHGAVPLSSGETAGHKYNLYLYGVSGSIAGASSGTIYNGLCAGETFGQFTPSSGTTFTKLSNTLDQSLVYELTTGYAVADITAAEVPTRLWTNLVAPVSTAATTGYTFASSVGAGTVTFTIPTSHLSETISSSYIEFPTSISLSDVAVSNSEGRVFFPEYHTAFSPSISATTSIITLAYGNSPSGFTSGNMRVFVPVIYKPSTINGSSTRTKTFTSNETESNIIKSSATTENGRSVITLANLDVFSIVSVTHSVNGDVASYFELDDGQREAHYEKSRLIVKPAYESTFTALADASTFTIIYKKFTHGGLLAAPFLGATAYIGISYENIPLFTNPRTGKTVSLANCLDFRHSGTTSDVEVIKPYRSTKPTELSYTHYLPRIDKVCLRTDPDDGSAEFFMATGTPDMSPTTPPDPLNAIVLASVCIPSFTHNPGDVLVTPYENKRFTMQDIGKIEKRIDDVEVFAKLSISEAEIDARSLKTLAGASSEPLKTSIIADEFVGHSIGDVASHEHICSVDYEMGEVRPFFTPATIDFSNYAFGSAGTTMSSDGLITLAYSTTNYIANTEWTKKIVVNPSNTVNWLGFASLTPDISTVYDVAYRPITKTNTLGENDNWLSSNANNASGFGTQWNDWESMWVGIEDNQIEQDDVQKQNLKVPHVKSDSVIPNINSGNSRVGVERTIIGIDEDISTRIRISRLKNRIKTRIGSRVVDRSVVPYIPATTGITLTVMGLKPNVTGLSVYFDGDSVRSGLSSDSYGSCGTTFSIPANTYLAGEKIVRISDSATIENANTSADVVYSCSGAFMQRDSGSYSTRSPVLRRQTVSSESITKNPFAREFSIDVLENSQWADPLSQTFFVDMKINPEGIFINDIDLFFSEKDSYLPITVQIRPTINGYPSPSVALPFSTKTLLPASVSVDTENPVATKFTFSSPIFLEPGEYALCIITNSNEYKAYVADSGFNALASGSSSAGRVGGNQKVGVLFLSTSMGIAVAENSTSLMFNVGRSSFSGSSLFTASISNNSLTKQVLKISSPEVIPYGCTINRKFIGDITESFKNSENIYLTTLLTGTPGVQYDFTGTEFVSPIVDTKALYGTAISMRTTSASPSSYVTRVISVDSQSSNGLAVFVGENQPVTSSIGVYYRVSPIGETDILTRPWVSMTRSTSATVSGSDIEYTEGVYGATLSSEFNSYQIKITLSSSGTPTYHKTSAARNIRAASFIQ